MTHPRFPTRSTIGDELLSAYLDGQVTAAERQRVEQALTADAGLRERYEALQMTVNLLQNAAPLRLPRAFVLSEAQVLAAGGKVRGAKQPGFFERLFPRMAPLATAAIAVLLVVLVGFDLLSGPGGGVYRRALPVQ
jgi:anti-sigma factor RsiW